MNPFTQFAGPEFLGFYGAVAGITLAICWWMRRVIDPTADEGIPPVPPIPDPYEIAYLRGGENELARVVIVHLVDKGYLQVVEGENKTCLLERTPSLSATDTLRPIERSVLDALKGPACAADVFGKYELPRALETHCIAMAERLQAARLLESDQVRQNAFRIGAFGAAVILGIGIPRLVIGLSNDKPVGWLVAMGLVALGSLSSLCSEQRLSARGRAFLKSVQAVQEPLRTHACQDPTLAAGVLGIEALDAAMFVGLKKMFPQSGGNGGGACGAACGGDGGCGGGCGGCGCGG